MPNVLIVAGETSGDLHGSGVVRELLLLKPDIFIWGIGGPKMREAGMTTEYDISQMAFMGFSEVVKHLPFVLGVFRHIKRLICQRQPDLVILIDYPGFNLRLADYANRQGCTVIYYISPQVWAWGRKRVKKIARCVHHVAVIFDFEEEFYRNNNVPATFVGHPLLETIRIPLTRDEFFRKYDLDSRTPVLALLPGSRAQEVQKMLPVMIAIAQQFKEQYPNCQFAVSAAQHVPETLYENIIRDFSCIRVDDVYDLMAHADVMMVASGTATLESAIIGTPFVMVYRLSSFSYFLGKWLIDVDHIAMANIVAGQKIVPEFIQNDFRSEKVVPYLLKLFCNSDKRETMKAGFETIRNKLGTPGASGRVAQLALSLMENNG